MNRKQQAYNEASIHFELYRQLVNEGYNVIPEYRYNPSTKHRADLAIMKDDKPILLIEAKWKSEHIINTSGPQYKRYQASGIPFIYKFDTTISDIISKLVKNH